MPLYSPGEVFQLLERYQVHPQRKLGQNFLVDGNIVKKIIKTAELKPEDVILEIGPGLGTMTQEMASICRLVVAIEIDPKLNQLLVDTFSAYTNVKLVQADAMKLDYDELLEAYMLSREKSTGQTIKVVANLPYSIASPLLIKLARSQLPIETMTLMVQKEVADRFTAVPGSKDYGATSVILRYYFAIEKAFNVSPHVFYPRPRVESTVVKLVARAHPPVDVPDEAHFFKFVKQAFAKRRKTLVNNILPLYRGTKQALIQHLTENAISPQLRGETLTLEEFAKIFKILYNYIDEVD